MIADRGKHLVQLFLKKLIEILCLSWMQNGTRNLFSVFFCIFCLRKSKNTFLCKLLQNSTVTCLKHFLFASWKGENPMMTPGRKFWNMKMFSNSFFQTQDYLECKRWGITGLSTIFGWLSFKSFTVLKISTLLWVFNRSRTLRRAIKVALFPRPSLRNTNGTACSVFPPGKVL